MYYKNDIKSNSLILCRQILNLVIEYEVKTVVAELVDAPDLGSGKYSCGGSSPPNRNYIKIIFMNL